MSQHSLELNPVTTETASPLSGKLFSEPDFAQSFADTNARTGSTFMGRELVFDSPYLPSDQDTETRQLPLLDPTLKDQLGKADSLEITSAKDNEASGTQPDYRIVEGEDGKLVLQKVGDGDPLADGKVNIEVNQKGNESLTEAIKQADKNLKEYIREMMEYWKQNHPGESFPGWWMDVLNSQPSIPADAQPVPVRPEQQASAVPSPRASIPPESAGRQQPVPTPGGGASGAGSGGSGSGGWGGSGRGGGDGQGAGYNPGGGYRGAGGSDTASSGAKPNSDRQTVLSNVKTVVEVAKEKGIDPVLAVATMLVESGGDNKAVGDGGSSIGLFQLHERGQGAGMSRAEREDPRRNAEVALGTMAQYASEERINDYNGDGQASPGELAASSQRPADQPGYAKKVEASMDEAHELIAMAEQSGDRQVARGDVLEAEGYVFPVAGFDKDSVGSHWGGYGKNGGTDIFAERGTPVLAIGGGTITSAGYSDIGGYNVSIKLDSGLVAYYAHMDQPPLVRQGDRVQAGQQVGVVGNSGNARNTDTHLHFGMGTDIITGDDINGGLGRNFNAVGLLNNILQNGRNA